MKAPVRKPQNTGNQQDTKDETLLTSFQHTHKAYLQTFGRKKRGINWSIVLVHLYYSDAFTAGLTELNRKIGIGLSTVQYHVLELARLKYITYNGGKATLTDNGRNFVEYYRDVFNGRPA